ncbi:MAG: hypothetical protein HOD43_08650 [Candidatus Marinimicrobia bacterium]|jgi:hypothetical protein|nr:hypothetical protein [Candidatus Neomarinimicrobiota bacterium]MBT3630570.1 hypothetical protein [Candidatus Neomarinimicrobiota bacterium]MBT3823361.1 hypothetical protein [Candidatus Neomarinimicrobiota bacterium]MBT4131426.1 hypothetical protein [Candidatus Neomarinimicrobiota bacterium]MBT4295857.1 hypothetical protein [Candidatus Neomarinimicrobiota bacterium]
MKTTTLRLVLLICVSLLFLTNCEDILDESDVSPEDSAAASALTADANASLLLLMGDLLSADPDSAHMILNSLDLNDPHNFYAQAHELDWRNQDANFGLGFTSVLILSQNTDLSSTYGTNAKVFEPFRTEDESSNTVGYGFGLPLSTNRVNGMIASYFEFPLASARINFEHIGAFNAFQTNVVDNFLPMIDAGLSALDSLDNDPAYVFNLGTGVQVAHIDIIAMESSLFAIQGIFKSLAAYNYELDTQDAAGIIAGLSLGSSFGTLNVDGASLLSEAHASALTSIERAETVIGMLEAETPEIDHFFVQFNRDALSQAHADLDGLNGALSGTIMVEYGYSDERGDIAIDGSASINISQYYLNSVTDFKTLLPLYSMSTTTDYNYNQVTLNEQINFEETTVTLTGLNNTPIAINIQYSESNGDTSATVSLGFLTFNLLTATQSDLPVAIWDLWAEFLVTVGDYSGELFNYPEISFQWSGFITTGSSLTIDGNIAVDYLERTSSYTAPDIQWTASSYGEWLAAWGDPTVQGMFPDFLAEDLAYLLGITWE